MTEAIHDVFMSEDQARSILVEAELFKQKTIEQAKHRTLQITTEKQKELEKKRNRGIEDMKEHCALEKEKILNQVEKEVQQLRKKAKAKISDAAETMIKEFEKLTQ